MTNVVDLAVFRKAKILGNPQIRVKPSSYEKLEEAPEDMGDRLQRIKASLGKINRLMTELKALHAEANDEHR